MQLEGCDWINVVRPYDLVIWKPDHMGPLGSAHLKERIYFLEKYLGKLVVPNFNTAWHFESKVAQSYLLALAGAATPATTATFDYRDASLRTARLRHAAGVQEVGRRRQPEACAW